MTDNEHSLAKEYLAAKDDARRLAISLHAKHFAETAPQWQPLTDLRGLISQIDNMTTALTKPAVPDVREDDEPCHGPEDMWCPVCHTGRAIRGADQ